MYARALDHELHPVALEVNLLGNRLVLQGAPRVLNLSGFGGVEHLSVPIRLNARSS